MKIHGLQKMTLLDFPGKVACTVFLGGCGFRCPFCHNGELLDVNAPAVTDDAALLDFLKTRTGLLDGVVITGGEPLLRPDLPELMRAIRALGYPIKLDTNGANPDKLIALVEEGLVQYVAMDVKNSPERYAETVGLPAVDIAAIDRSIRYLLQDHVDYEFRTTVVRELHDAASFRAIASWIAGAKRYYLQSFVDRDTVLYGGLHAPEKAEMEAYAAIARKTVQTVELRGV